MKIIFKKSIDTYINKLFRFWSQFLIIPSFCKKANWGFMWHLDEMTSWSLWCQIRESIFPLFYTNSQQQSKPLTNTSSQESLSCDTTLSSITSYFSIFFTSFFLDLTRNVEPPPGLAQAHFFPLYEHNF